MRSAFTTVQIGYSIKIIYAHVAYKCNQNLPATCCRALSLGHLGKSLISKAFIFQLFIDDCVETEQVERFGIAGPMHNVVCNKSLGPRPGSAAARHGTTTTTKAVSG